MFHREANLKNNSQSKNLVSQTALLKAIAELWASASVENRSLQVLLGEHVAEAHRHLCPKSISARSIDRTSVKFNF